MNAASRFAAFAGSARLVAAALMALVASVATAQAAATLTFDGNAARAAWLNADHSVNTRNVSTLHLKWVAKLDSTADSTPIYVAHVAKHGAMLFNGCAGKTYGVDAATGAIVWRFQPTGVRITASTPVSTSTASTSTCRPSTDTCTSWTQRPARRSRRPASPHNSRSIRRKRRTRRRSTSPTGICTRRRRATSATRRRTTGTS